MAQVDLGTRQNRHQPLRDLSRMSYAVLRAVARRMRQDGRLNQTSDPDAPRVALPVLRLPATPSRPPMASSSRSTSRSSSSARPIERSPARSARGVASSGPHDLGGEPAAPWTVGGHDVEDWERLADAVNSALGKRGLQTTDEHRRAIEGLPNYRDLAYYERWAAATEALLVEKGILTDEEIDERAAEIESRWEGALTARFDPGDRVRVRPAAKPGHVRTPGLPEGQAGAGRSRARRVPQPRGPRLRSLRRSPERVLYKVTFRQGDLWDGYEGTADERLYADVYEHWLEPAERGAT